MTLISKESLLKKFESGALLFQPDVRKIIEEEPEVNSQTVVKIGETNMTDEESREMTSYLKGVH